MKEHGTQERNSNRTENDRKVQLDSSKGRERFYPLARTPQTTRNVISVYSYHLSAFVDQRVEKRHLRVSVLSMNSGHKFTGKYTNDGALKESSTSISTLSESR